MPDARIKSLCVAALIIAALSAAYPLVSRGSTSQPPIVLELFTSEGCSSCPPADRLLEKLQGSGIDGRRVIAISEHVDYWNYLGWKDKFSSPLYGQRQQEYASAFKQSSAYTPEVVIDGSFGTNGSDISAIAAFARRNHAKQKVDVEIKLPESLGTSRSGLLAVSVHPPAKYSGGPARILLLVTEDNLSSPVRSGENGGKLLRHAAVARSCTVLRKAIALHGETVIGLSNKISLDPSWNAQNLRVVVLVQAEDTKQIIGAQEVKVSP